MKTFNIIFNEQQLQVLSAALVELPFKLSEPVIRHINVEIQKQLGQPSGEGLVGQAETSP
jgi:hypothetical protein